MNRKSRIIVSVVGITIVMLALLGLTYAYYLTRIDGNTNTNSISVTTANLLLTYNDGNGALTPAESLEPGMAVKFLDESRNVVESKIFSITNNGNAVVKDYAVVLEEVINMLERYEDMQMILTCTSSVSGKECNGRVGSLPNKNDVLVLNSIEKNEVQTYELKLTYIEAGVDQSVDMGKTISAKINIYNSQDTVDIEGTVASYSEGDYIQVNSVPKKSQIGLDNKYKVVGVLPGEHTISLYSKDGVLKGSKEFKVTQGEVAGVNGDTITIDEKSRTVNLDLNSDYSINIDSNISNTAHGSSYSLASVIVNNAKNVTSTQKSKGYAEFLTKPKTTPAVQTSATNESVLSVTEDDYGNSYYFRGNVKNNYVNFAGKCWRILRIQGDGSTKLILEDANDECNSASYTGNWSAGQTVYGYDANKRADYDGYNGGLKTKLTDWYNTNISDYQSLLKSEQACLGDITTKYNENNSVSTGTQDYYQVYRTSYSYDVHNRLSKLNKATLKCAGTKTNSTYVYTITADEVTYAGGKNNFSPTNFYLQNDYQFQNYLSFWTLSAAGADTWNDYNYNYNYESAYRVSSYGILTRGDIYKYSDDNNAACVCSSSYTWYDWEYGTGSHTTTFVARPMVSLISGIALSTGDGSITNPYVIN